MSTPALILLVLGLSALHIGLMEVFFRSTTARTCRKGLHHWVYEAGPPEGCRCKACGAWDPL